MTITEHLDMDLTALKSSGVVFPLVPGTHERQEGKAVPFDKSPWVHFVFPAGEEKSSSQVTEVFSPSEQEESIPRTELWRKLALLRRMAILSGMRLLSEDEVLEEVRRRRGGF